MKKLLIILILFATSCSPFNNVVSLDYEPPKQEEKVKPGKAVLVDVLSSFALITFIAMYGFHLKRTE